MFDAAPANPLHAGGRPFSGQGKKRVGRLIAQAAILGLCGVAPVSSAGQGSSASLLVFTPGSAQELAKTLDRAWATPRPSGTLPNLAPDSFPSGMDRLPTDVKKRTFC